MRMINGRFDGQSVKLGHSTIFESMAGLYERNRRSVRYGNQDVQCETEPQTKSSHHTRSSYYDCPS